MRGFTLVEMMVSVAVFSILALALFAVLSTGSSVYQSDTIFQEIQQEARNGMDRVVREVRESSVCAITVVDADHDRVSFNTPNENAIQYYVTGTELIREYPAGTMHTVAQDITHLKFVQNGMLLTIALTAQKIYRGKTYTFPLQENVRLRNE